MKGNDQHKSCVRVIGTPEQLTHDSSGTLPLRCLLGLVVLVPISFIDNLLSDDPVRRCLGQTIHWNRRDGSLELTLQPDPPLYKEIEGSKH